MKLSSPLTYLCLAITATLATPAPERHIYARANLPGLNAVQTQYAKAIIAQAKKDGIGAHGCQAAIAASMADSSLIMYANDAVPESLDYPHDRVSADGDRVGLFQQSASVYADVACGMDTACSAGRFYAEMRAINGWETAAVAKICQTVQESLYSDRYAKQVSTATNVCKAEGL